MTLYSIYVERSDEVLSLVDQVEADNPSKALNKSTSGAGEYVVIANNNHVAMKKEWSGGDTEVKKL